MTLLTDASVRRSLDRLKAIPEYQVKLIMANLQEPEEHTLYNQCMHITTKPEGKAPAAHAAMTNVTNLPSPLSALKGNTLCKLYQFLHNNGGYAMLPTKEDGDCFYGAWGRGTDFKAEVADIHLKRAIIKVMSRHHEFFYKTFHYAVSQQYGLYRYPEEELQAKIADGSLSAQDVKDQRMPGPFSWYEFLAYHLTPSTYADDIIICVVSMLWQMKITVLKAQDLSERRFRHNGRLGKAELLLVFCEETSHFVSAGKCLYLIRSNLIYW